MIRMVVQIVSFFDVGAAVVVIALMMSSSLRVSSFSCSMAKSSVSTSSNSLKLSPVLMGEVSAMVFGVTDVGCDVSHTETVGTQFGWHSLNCYSCHRSRYFDGST